ncbi:MAG: Transcriptional regulator [Segetibacter sp.]|nr:Transcriptional regulator [Segetibacter sp.]
MPQPNGKGLNEGLNEGLKSVLKIIHNNPGIQAKTIAELLDNRPIKSVDRQIKTLIEKGLVERKGSKKTGGYFISKNGRRVNSENSD